MISPHYFVVTPMNGQRYDNIRDYGGKEFIISSSQEDHTVTNRVAVVQSVPIGYDGPIKKDDLVIVHHNVFRIYYDMKGNDRSSWNHYKGDVFMIEHEQLFLYKSPDGDWNAPYPYCFVEPVSKMESKVATLGVEEHLVGSIAFIPDNTLLKKGDMVSFIPESEYEFNIDSRKLYRMKIKNLCLKL